MEFSFLNDDWFRVSATLAGVMLYIAVSTVHIKPAWKYIVNLLMCLLIGVGAGGALADYTGIPLEIAVASAAILAPSILEALSSRKNAARLFDKFLGKESGDA